MTAARLLCWLASAILLGGAALPRSGAAPEQPALRPLVQVMEKAIRDGEVVGAQIAVSDREGILLSAAFGHLAPGSDAKVDESTLFCIGSCSKPIAAACILTLVDRKVLDLDERVGKYLPAFRRLQVEGGAAARRAPTIRELLAHRGGIYSQKNKLTPPQRRAIRDFTLSLEQSVAIIARQKLLSQPGSAHAYSGAGYCVLGRVAEVAGRKPFEALFRESLARPLGVERSTYFPAPTEKNIALGGRKTDGRVEADTRAPHLQGESLRLPLIGGSLYSPARETAAFARMLLNEGRSGRQEVLSAASWRESTRRQYPDQSYGLGWGLAFGPTKGEHARSLNHTGALGCYRSVVHIDLAGGKILVAHWTLADPDSRETAGRLARQIDRAWAAIGPLKK
jgi:CubicO group peptidase (beta-lactamase class C family)